MGAPLEPPRISRYHRARSNGTILVLDTTDTTEPFASLPLNSQEPISVFIGPEGGFSADERKEFKNQDWLFTTLGPTVLRIETRSHLRHRGNP